MPQVGAAGLGGQIFGQVFAGLVIFSQVTKCDSASKHQVVGDRVRLIVLHRFVERFDRLIVFVALHQRPTFSIKSVWLEAFVGIGF